MYYTKACASVVEILQGAHRPMSLEEIHTQLACSGISAAFSTVFRIVNKLLERQQVLVTSTSRGSVYEWLDTSERLHIHLVCPRCHGVQCTSDAPLAVREWLGSMGAQHVTISQPCVLCQ